MKASEMSVDNDDNISNLQAGQRADIVLGSMKVGVRIAGGC